MDAPRIGFVGLGTMGTPLATHLIEAGHELAVTDTNPQALRRPWAPASKRRPPNSPRPAM